MEQPKERKDSKERIKEITEQLHDGIKDLFQSEKYKDYLRVMSKFTNYSFNNTVLIAMQRPDTQAVAGYRAWQTKFDRHVKKGSKAIAIIEPTTWKRQKLEIMVDDNGNPLRDKDGRIIKEETEQQIQGFKVGSVFAYEDTEGKELPQLVSILNRDVEGYDTLMDLLQAASPAPIHFEEIHSAANGFYSLETHDIHVDSRLPELQKVKTAIHEMAHSILHDQINGTDPEANRYEREVCAESVAFTVCNYWGLDTSEYSFGYIGGWSEGKELKELQQKMEIIRKTANSIISSVEKEVINRKEAMKQEQIQQSDILQPVTKWDFPVQEHTTEKSNCHKHRR